MAQPKRPRPPKPHGVSANPRVKGKRDRIALPTLNDLARQRPTRVEINTFPEHLEDQPARVVAITYGALLEALLEDALMAHMLVLNPKRFDELFRDANAPLSTWSAKTLLAHALGILGDEMRSQMDQVRKIRNAFAHAIRSLDFDNPTIKAACMSLDCQRLVRPDIVFADAGESARERLVACSLLMGHHLVEYIQSRLNAIKQGRQSPVETFHSRFV